MWLFKFLLRLFSILSGAAILAVLLYGLLFYMAYPKTPTALIKVDPLKQADAIVFLGGQANRFDYAVDLFQQGYAPLLYSPGGEYPGMNRYIRQRVGQLAGATLVIDSSVPDGTYGEAVNTARFAKDHHLRCIILVTSPYHTYRAHWIFKQLLPQVRIISAAVPYDKSFWDESAPINPQRYAAFKREQEKFLGYYVLYSWPIKWLGLRTKGEYRYSQALTLRIGRWLQRWLDKN